MYVMKDRIAVQKHDLTSKRRNLNMRDKSAIPVVKNDLPARTSSFNAGDFWHSHDDVFHATSRADKKALIFKFIPAEALVFINFERFKLFNRALQPHRADNAPSRKNRYLSRKARRVTAKH